MSIPVQTVAGAIATGEIVPAALPDAVTRLGTVVPEPGPGVTVEARAIATGAVSALVGAVSLEAFGHLAGADRGAVYAAYSLQVMRGMGFTGTPGPRRGGARGLLNHGSAPPRTHIRSPPPRPSRKDRPMGGYAGGEGVAHFSRRPQTALG
jgi:hypothetical protein